MADVIDNSTLNLSVTLVLNEAEARMLIEMTGYGANPFLKGYYKILGKSYMQPHEKALKSFFSSINKRLPQAVKRIDEARKVFNGEE